MKKAPDILSLTRTRAAERKRSNLLLTLASLGPPAKAGLLPEQGRKLEEDSSGEETLRIFPSSSYNLLLYSKSPLLLSERFGVCWRLF